MGKGFIADIPGHPEGDIVINLTHDPLGQRSKACADHDSSQIKAHGLEIHAACINDAVNGIAHQNGDVEGHGHLQRCQKQGPCQRRPIGPDPAEDFFHHALLIIRHDASPPWETGNNRFPGKRSSLPEAPHGYPTPPAFRHPEPGSGQHTAQKLPAGKR